MIQFALAALFAFAVLTFWVPAYWPVTVFQIGIFVLAIATVIGWASRRDRPQISKSRDSNSQPRRMNWLPFYPLLPLSFAVFWGLLQIVTRHTAYLFETQAAIVRWATFLALFLVAASTFRRNGFGWFRSAMLWFAFGISVLAVLQTFTSRDRIFWIFPAVYPGPMGPFPSPNHFAAFIEAVLPFALWESIRRDRVSVLYSAVAAALYASVIASSSRAGMFITTLEIIVALSVICVRRRASGRALALFLAPLVLLLAVFTTVVGWQRLWTRLSAPDPMRLRREYNISSLKMIAEHPFWGTGLGTWPAVYPSYAITDNGLVANQAHDDWMQWTVEGGLPLGISLATIFVWCLRPVFRTVWGLGAIAVFLHAFVDYPFSRPAMGSWVFLVVAMLSATYASHIGRNSFPQKDAEMSLALDL